MAAGTGISLLGALVYPGLCVAGSGKDTQAIDGNALD
jgi:hypothetical protein